MTSELLTAGLVTHHGGLATWPRGIRLPFRPLRAHRRAKGHHASSSDPSRTRRADAGKRFIDTWRAEQGVRWATPATSRSSPARRSGGSRPTASGSSPSTEAPTCSCPPSDYARLPWLNPLKARLNLREYQTRRWDPLPERFVFLPLQVQPESSVDVMGQEWRDQAYTARVLADALAPLGIGVAVKEHAHFMWRRDPDYWPQFDVHPNIATIDPFADSRELMQQAVFTVTATGTVGLEAGLLGLPVITGAEMPWSGLGNVLRLATPDDLVGVRRGAWLGGAAGHAGGDRRVVRPPARPQLVGGPRPRPAARPACSSRPTSAASVTPSPRPRQRSVVVME